MLKDLPPGNFDKDYGQRPPTSAATNPMSFMCDKQLFKDTVRLAELRTRLAEKSHNPPENEPDPFTKTILVGIKSLEAKADQLALDTANLANKPAPPSKSFEDLAAATPLHSTSVPKPKTGAKGKKPAPSPAPPKVAQIMLSQLSINRADHVELLSDAGSLVSRASEALQSALREQATKDGLPPVLISVRGITRNNFTGVIQLHLNNRARMLAVFNLKSDGWVAEVSPKLYLK